MPEQMEGFDPELEQYKTEIEGLFNKHREDWVRIGAAFLRSVNYPEKPNPITAAQMSDTYRSHAEDAVQEVFTRLLAQPDEGIKALQAPNQKAWVSQLVEWELKRQYKSVGKNRSITDAAAPFRSESLESMIEDIDEGHKDIAEQHGGSYQLDELLPDKVQVREELETLLSNLKPRQEKILRMRLGLMKDDSKEYTTAEIAKHFNISESRVGKLKNQALEKLQLRATLGKLNKFKYLSDEAENIDTIGK